MKECAVSYCSKEVRARNWCWGHYQEWRRFGTAERTTKICNTCQLELPIEKWGGKISRNCESCRPIDAQAWRYGLTGAQLYSMLKEADFKCEICGIKPDTHRVAVDHDHKCCPTGSRSCGKCVRGVLCRSCNIALGLLKEDTDRMQGMIKYAERF